MPRSRAARWAFVTAAVIATAIAGIWLAAAHATWARPMVQRYVAEHSHRSIDFDRLQFGLTDAFEPTITFRGLKVQNAPWAAKRPLATAGELTFVISWKTLHEDKYVVRKLVLVDASIDLERKADGLRNWRLGNPEDRGPGRIRVLSVDAVRSDLRLLQEGAGLDVAMRMSPLATPQSTAGGNGPPLTRHFEFEGTRNGRSFSGDAAVSELLTFADTGQPFALRGQASSAGSHVQLEGVVTDVQQFASLELDVQLASNRLSDLEVGVPVALPSAATNLRVVTHLSKRANTWAMTAIQARLGESDLHGDVSIEDRRHASAGAPATPSVHGSLASDSLHSADFSGLARVDKNAAKVDPPEAGGAAKRHLDGAALSRFDADIDLRVGRLALPASPSGKSFDASRLDVHFVLDRGRLAVAPFAFDILGGRVTGEAHVDGTQAPLDLTLAANAAGLRAEKLGKTLVGGVDGKVTLRAQGNTLDAGLASATGSVDLSLANASIPKRLDARMGLDGLAILGTMFGDAEERVPVQCGVLALDVRAGRATARRMALETERVAIAGSGTANLAGRSVDLLLTPTLKQRALIALDRSIHVAGPVSAPKVELVDRVQPAAGAAGCATVRNPLTPVVARSRPARDTASQSIAVQLSQVDSSQSLPIPEKP